MFNRKNGKNKKRRFVTLIEMMIVMFLIALITGVVAYNYSGSLEAGKAFKTEVGMEKLKNVLMLTQAENSGASIDQWREIVSQSPLVQNANALIKDGWGVDYTVTQDPATGQVSVSSARYDQYRATHPKG